MASPSVAFFQLRPSTLCNMNRQYHMLRAWRPSHALHPVSPLLRSLSIFSRLRRCHSDQTREPSARRNADCQNVKGTSAVPAAPKSLSAWQHTFWTCQSTWKRARINTLRCLVGCTVGDFSSLWILQSFYPELGMGPIMTVSSKFSLAPPCYIESHANN